VKLEPEERGDLQADPTWGQGVLEPPTHMNPWSPPIAFQHFLVTDKEEEEENEEEEKLKERREEVEEEEQISPF